jgi:hypothetical protein
MLRQRRGIQGFFQIFLFILMAAWISGCASTVTYHNVQKDFNDAVQVDNLPSTTAIGTLTSSTLVGYEDVLAALDDKYIDSLDPKLRINAYAMKAVSQWRTAKFDEAKKTAETGLGLANVPSSPRDRMVLLIIKPLVNEQDLRFRYLKLDEPKRLTTSEYQETYAKDFADIAAALKNALAQATPDLPPDVLYYVYYQRWRVLQDWDTVISHLWDGKDFHSEESNKIQDRAFKDAANVLNVADFKQEIKSQKENIPRGYWLRNYMEAKENE